MNSPFKFKNLVIIKILLMPYSEKISTKQHRRCLYIQAASGIKFIGLSNRIGLYLVSQFNLILDSNVRYSKVY